MSAARNNGSKNIHPHIAGGISFSGIALPGCAQDDRAIWLFSFFRRQLLKARPSSTQKLRHGQASPLFRGSCHRQVTDEVYRRFFAEISLYSISKGKPHPLRLYRREIRARCARPTGFGLAQDDRVGLLLVKLLVQKPRKNPRKPLTIQLCKTIIFL